MSKMLKYELEISGISIPYSPQSRVLKSQLGNKAFSLSNHTLYEFEFLENPQPIIRKTKDDNYPFSDDAKLVYVESLDDEQTLIVVKVTQGIRIYLHSKDLLRLAVEDDRFHDVYGWNKPENCIDFGHFYHDSEIFGMMSSHSEYGTKFYGIMKDDLLAGKFPIFDLETNVEILETYSPNSSERMLADLMRNSKPCVVSRNPEGISCFEFNEVNQLEFVMNVSLGGMAGAIFFADLTHQKFNDIVHLNSSGLFVYQIFDDYKLVSYNPQFSEEKGWNTDHTKTVRFVNLNAGSCMAMIYTGPKGIEAITYNTHSRSWCSLFRSSNFPPKLRHAPVMHVIPRNDESASYIYFNIEESITCTKLIQVTSNPTKVVESCSPSIKNSTKTSITPLKINTPQVFQPTILLRDMEIWSNILNCVDLETGKPKFSLPLFNLSVAYLNLTFDYDATRCLSDVLGIGWSMSLNVIAMDDQGSVFDEDAVYVINLNGSLHALVYLLKESSEVIHVYTLASKNENIKFRATFYAKEDIWIVDLGTGAKLFYGQRDSSKNAAVWKDIVWKNWHGPGFDSTGQMERSREWYLSQVQDKCGSILLEFVYDMDTKQIDSGLKYTRAAYIRSLRDCQGNAVEFRYLEKNPDEYMTNDLNDKEGNYNWEPLQTRYLSAYKFTTPNRGTQEVSLNYSTSNGLRFLTEIRQENDVINNFVANFEYLTFPKGKFGLKNVRLPNDVEVTFTYAAVGKGDILRESKRINVPSNYKVTHGGDYLLVSFPNGKTPAQVVLRMFNQDMTEELYSSHASVKLPANRRWPLLGLQASTVDHQVIQGVNYFGVILYYAASKCLYLFGHKPETRVWMQEPQCHIYCEEAVIEAGQDFCLIADPGSQVELLEWKSMKGVWQQHTIMPCTGSTVISVHKNKYVTYDNLNLSLGYRTEDDIWKHKILVELPNCASKTEELIQRFNLDTTIHKVIAATIRNHLLKLSHNLVALNCLQLNGHQLQSSVKLYTIDSLKNVSATEEFTIEQDDLDAFVSEEERNKDNGNSFKFKYEIMSNGQFYLKVDSLQGPLLEELREKNALDHIPEVKGQIEKNINMPAKRFLLPLSNYLMQFSDQVLILNDQKLNYGGSKWLRTTLTVNESNIEHFRIPLGKRFVLEKANEKDTIKLLRKGTQEILSTLSVNPTDVQIFYPIYLTTHTKGSSLKLSEFEGTEVKEKVLPAGEILSPFSTSNLLITHQGDNIKTLIFRQQYGISKYLPNYAVSQVTIVFDDDRKKRVTGYEYDADDGRLTGSAVSYSKIAIIPANNKNNYGWLSKSLVDGSSIAYDNHGKVVRNIPFEKHANEDHKLDDEEMASKKDTTIYDKSGQLEIAQCTPFRPADEVVSYYGFEEYEENTIGLLKQWTFSSKNIIRNGFALTGKNYLHQNTEPLEGIFQPTNQDSRYIASTWVRLQNATESPQIGEETPFLKAFIYTARKEEVDSLLGEVKLRIDDWIYLELIIDLTLARRRAARDPPDNLRIVIRCGPTPKTTIDIDHLRFAPLSSNFCVNIFDATTNTITATISSKGSIKRTLHDAYKRIVGKVNEQNHVEDLTVYTKSGTFQTSLCMIRVRPEVGFYEQFSPFSFVDRWQIDDSLSWGIAPYQLDHRGDGRHTLQLNSPDVATESHGFRVSYSLSGDRAAISINDFVTLSKSSNRCSIDTKANVQSIPPNGEIVMVKEDDRLLVWIDGALYIDQTTCASNERLKLSMEGAVSFRDMMVFTKSHVKVVYQNSLHEPTQEVSLKSAESIVVKERLYDELGRQRITTQDVQIRRSKVEPLMMYISNFVTNDGFEKPNSIWRTSLLEGLVTSLTAHSYGFVEASYNKNPLNEIAVVGHPGKDFSTHGRFAKRYTTTTTNLFVTNRFPPSKDVSYKVELKLGGMEDITVLNNQNQKIAHYIHVPGGKDLFSTHMLNNEGKILQILPPIYFYQVGFFHKTNSELLTVSEEENRLQRKLGVHIAYDQNGKPIYKTTADAGPFENVYDSERLLRFVLYYSYADPSLLENIVYFTYDQVGRLSSTGQFLDLTTAKDQLLDVALDARNSLEYQSFDRGPFKGDLKSITKNSDVRIEEVMHINDRGDALYKSILISQLPDEPVKIDIRKHYEGERLHEIIYPAQYLGQTLRAVYGYDRLGNIISIGTAEEPNKFMKLEHNAAGQVTEETYEPTSIYKFTQLRNYNEPGYLTKLSNPFQSEEISYTNSSYGGANRGDGSVTRIKFTTKWQSSVSCKGLGLNPHSFVNESMSPVDSTKCFDALKNAGYLDNKNRQLKAFYPNLEIDFPIICTSGSTGRHVSNVLGRHGFPREHGYRFDYGAHQELTKAKYFVGSDEPEPLQPDTFAKEIPQLSSDASSRIWSALEAGQFLVEDPDRTNLSTSHGKEFLQSFINSNLFYDLRDVSPDYGTYADPLKNLLASQYFERKQNFSQTQLQYLFSKWLGNTSVAFVQRTACDIFEMLQKKDYFLNPLDKVFEKSLSEFRPYFPDIVRVLFTYFARQLGRSEFDEESYEIDANGNHKVFNAGYNSYTLEYEPDSNRVIGVHYKAYDSPKPNSYFRMQHDSRGNVIQALHKGIMTMEYHPVSNRLRRVKTVNGDTVEFYYDSNGERVLKRVTDSSNNVRKEMHYLRDENGRTLVERELSFLAVGQPPDVLETMYIYGSTGIVGFVRRDQFYSVLTDHQGSVRIIVRDGEVVAAYDYLPYGNLMRIFGADTEAHIPYRYTGQEWDPEIGLYNYHARFYDPDIGRFYQIDPQEQYFSPYKYAGNSPISMVDPDGEFALVIAFKVSSLVVGAYLGGAASNNLWNPFKWEVNLNTVNGIILGGLGGFALPGGFFASVGAFGVVGLSTTAAIAATASTGAAIAYLSAASTNGKWNPRDWEFRSPKTWNAIFEGVQMGIASFGGLHNVSQFYQQLNARGKKTFLSTTILMGSALFVKTTPPSDWDPKKPKFWFGTVSSMNSASNFTLKTFEGLSTLRRMVL